MGLERSLLSIDAWRAAHTEEKAEYSVVVEPDGRAAVFFEVEEFGVSRSSEVRGQTLIDAVDKARRRLFASINQIGRVLPRSDEELAALKAK